ncbi:MAG TPA: class I SAM-dependent methyltransferase [Acidimicrobiales bacterium]|nr:class I SAM-dependent methyltransferase [Acidimicrobiales bacterium]
MADLLELPFDQYQRYQVTAELLGRLGVGAGATVLEVGGAPGPLEGFLPDHEVFVVDLNGKREGRYAMADGARLPFADDTFDVVVTLDTLEHVPAADRDAFLREAKRVSTDLIVLSAPFGDPALELAEDAVNAFVRQRFGGDFPTLDEHRDHGLPVLDETVERVANDGWNTAVLPSGYLPRWLLGMIFHHELLATGVPSLGALHAYYNRTVSPLDCRAPSYRHVILASRSRPAAELEAAVDGLRSDGGEDAAIVALGAIASAVLAQRLDGRPERAVQELATLERAIADVERQVVDRDAHIVELRHTIDRLVSEREDANNRLAQALNTPTLADRVIARARKARS